MSLEYGNVQKLTVPTADVVDNNDMRDSVGNKLDTAQTTPAVDKSLMAYSKGILTNIAALSLLTNEQRALLPWGNKPSIAPLMETFQGLFGATSLLAANNAITMTQMAAQAARYPGAGAWTYRVALSLVLSSQKDIYIQQSTGAAAGNKSGIICHWPAVITGATPASWAPNNERLVWEAVVKCDTGNGNGNAIWFFIGMCMIDPSADFTSVVGIADKTNTTYTRCGFVTNNSADKKLVGINCDGAAVSVLANFTAEFNKFHHYKMVYDIGTGIEFFYDGVSKGSILTNLPVSGINNYALFPFFSLENVSAGVEMQITGVRCYFQNGA